MTVTVDPINAYHVQAAAPVPHTQPSMRTPASIPVSIARVPTRFVNTPTRKAPRTGPAASERTASPAASTEPVTYCAATATAICAIPQKIVAWHAATDKRTPLVLTPLRMALWDRDRNGTPVLAGQLVHHHDAGSQYTSIRFTEHLALEDITPSIGTVGDAYDNALMESIIGLYKTECVRPGPFHSEPLRTTADVEYATMAWVDWWNNRRLHSTLGMLTPAEHEQDHYAALSREPQPV